MTDTGGALGLLEGVSSRAILTADHITIQPHGGANETVISLQDIPRVIHEWPWQSGVASRPGYVQFVTREDTVVGGAFALHKGRPNVVEINVAQLPRAIAFVSRLENMLPNRNDRYTPERRDLAPIASPPQPPATTVSSTPPPSPRPIWKPTTPVAAPSTPTVATTRSSPELERIGRVSNGHLGTIATGVALIASFLVCSFWFTFWIGFLSTAFPPKGDALGFVYQSDYFSAGRTITALIAAAIMTYGSWKITRSVIGAD